MIHHEYGQLYRHGHRQASTEVTLLHTLWHRPSSIDTYLCRTVGRLRAARANRTHGLRHSFAAVSGPVRPHVHHRSYAGLRNQGAVCSCTVASKTETPSKKLGVKHTQSVPRAKCLVLQVLILAGLEESASVRLPPESKPSHPGWCLVLRPTEHPGRAPRKGGVHTPTRLLTVRPHCIAYNEAGFDAGSRLASMSWVASDPVCSLCDMT